MTQPDGDLIDGFETIEVRLGERRASIHLNRPASLNPLSTHTLAEIERASDVLDAAEDLRVVVVAGHGRAFSAGADLHGFTGSAGRRERDQGWRTARALERLRAVTVARLQGWCVGGGLVLASACDLRVAADDTRFAIPEVDLGIPLAWGGIPRLVRELGPALTKELVMTCRPFDAAEAKAAGFLNRVVPAIDLDEEVETLVSTLLDKPAFALLATKAHTNAVAESMVHTGGSWGDAELLWAGFMDAEGADARRRYLERRSSH
jgi:enoyl-CoA hydratase/carnithine racemase